MGRIAASLRALPVGFLPPLPERNPRRLMYRHANGTLNRLPIMCLKVGEGNRTRDRLFTKISGNGPAQFDSRADRVKGRKGLAQELCNATCLRPGRISHHLATLLARDHPDDRVTRRSLHLALTASNLSSALRLQLI